MDAAFTTEQDEIRRTLRELLLKRCGPDQVKAAVRTPYGWDAALWRQLAEQLGLPGLALPVAYGGVGCGPAELALACEETGRALLPSPLLSSAVLVAPLIRALGTEQQRAALLPQLAAGVLTAALAVPAALLPVALGLTGAQGPTGAMGPTGDGAPDRISDRIGDRIEDRIGARPRIGVTGGRGADGSDRHGHRAGAADGSADDAGGWAGGGRAGGVQARRGPDGWQLYGQADQVLDGHSAGLLLVAARTGGYTHGRTLLFLVRSGAVGLTRTRLTVLDETRPQARIELRDVPAELLGTAGSSGASGPSRASRPSGAPGSAGSPAHSTAAIRPGASSAAEGAGGAGGIRGATARKGEAEAGAGAGVGGMEPPDVVSALAALGGTVAAVLAAEAVGAADAVFTATVEYVRRREQFGRPIGSFQAVQHRLADLHVRIEAARSAAYYAAWDADRCHRDPSAPATAVTGPPVGGLALAQALEAQRTVAGEAIQLHGGIGFTWEHDAHLYFKRAASDELLFGPVHRLRAHAAEGAGLFLGDGERFGDGRGRGAVGVR
ncbi:acyl-CoA dehydrogenase family protein [Streptomyces sp. bgisy100]|uniref:acyl-CoA dehydrogenase family protein n=1 Tax=Streptomyces sp. bgisy100 TaxID=3413783 RepID=UPI003D713109